MIFENITTCDKAPNYIDGSWKGPLNISSIKDTLQSHAALEKY